MAQQAVDGCGGELRVFLPGRHGALHVRIRGSGPPVLLLHPSPLSSRMVAPVASALVEPGDDPDFRPVTTIALDTPGYGLSAPLPAPPGSMADFVPPIAAALEALGLESVVIYGSATGAQLAIEFARVHPQMVAGLVLDNAAHFTAVERGSILPGYFPDLAPRGDGAHLVTGWTMMREASRTFPWHSRRAADRVGAAGPLPPRLVQSAFLDLLRAGSTYQRAYRVAFENERAERLAAVSVPVRVLRWADGLLGPQTDALLARALPRNVSRVDAASGKAPRMAAIRQCVRELAVGLATVDLPEALAGVAGAGPAPARRWLSTAAGDLHARWRPGSDRALVLHAPGRSADQLVLPAARELLCPDLPGHGETVVGPRSPQDCAALLAEALAGQGWDRFEIHADGASQAVGEALAGIVAGVSDVIARPGPVIAAAALAPPAPRASGAHLVELWSGFREEAVAAGLDFDPPLLQAALLDRLRVAPPES